MANKADITPELLRQLIEFDKSTGKYFWKKRDAALWQGTKRYSPEAAAKKWNEQQSGTELFKSVNSHGYSKCTILGIGFTAHRIIWAFHYGEWPTQNIDHVNRVKTDNRLENLRLCTHAENSRNRSHHKNNTSGRIGVHWAAHKLKWHARIVANGKRKCLGFYDNFSDAVRAREDAEKMFGYSSPY